MKLIVPLAYMALLAGCAASGKDAVLSWPAAPRSFTDAGDVARVASQFPHSAGMQRRVLAAALTEKDIEAARHAAERLAAMGAGLSAGGREQVRGVIGDDPMATLAPRFEANVGAVGTSEPHGEIGPEHLLIEGVIWDEDAKALYATSVIGKSLLRISEDGRIGVVPTAGAGSLFGGAYDRRSRRLWLASAAIEETPGGGFSGLIGVSPRAEPPLTVAAPEGATLGDVAVGPDGALYASDGMKGDVYVCAPGCAALARLVPQGSFFSAQGLAVSDDGKRLYVADYRYGLAAVDIASRRIAQVTAASPMMLDGIDGLARHGRDLIAVQNGGNPLRIVRIRLASDGFRVTSLEVLERGNPSWGEPSLGRVIRDRFVYVANPQWEKFGAKGTIKPGEVPAPTIIRGLKLR